MLRRPLLLAVCLAAAAAAGCQPPKATLHPLTGTLTHGGKPVSGGGLIFIPDAGGWGGNVVDAAVNPDGTFAAHTAHTTADQTDIRPGAPAGRYKVVYNPPSDGQRDVSVELPGRVTVEAKDNTVSLVLPEKQPEGRGEKRDDGPAAPVPNPDEK